MKFTNIAGKGLFITLEGPEGAGKSTQLERLAATLAKRGCDVLQTREPGGTALGEELRRLIKYFGEPGEVGAEAELLMFGASRAQLMREVILPHLSRGGVVISDRFADSTTVYQGYARQLDTDFIERMHTLTLCGRWPDLTLLLDVDMETGYSRIRARRGEAAPDRIEAESRDFHQAVREGFLRLAEAHPERIAVICAAVTPDQVHKRIMEVVDRALS